MIARLARFAWVVVAPAIVASIALRELVPDAGDGVRGWIATIGRAHPMALWCGVFLATSFAASEAIGHPAPRPPPRRRGGGVVVTVVVAAACAIALRLFVVDVHRVTSASMLPTLAAGDFVAGWKRGGAIQRGDVVVFRATPTSEPMVKRVVGLPGDRIAMSSGAPVINGWIAPTCDAGEYLRVLDASGRFVHGRLRVEWIGDAAYVVVQSGAESFAGAFDVPPGEVFVLGDDRGSSVDSRAWNDGRGGGLALSAIEAKVRWHFASGDRADASDAAARVAACLARPPRDTRPPSSLDARSASTF